MTEAHGYLARVERFWFLLRRRGLMLSAQDVQLVERWRMADVPERVVCQALLEGAESYRERHGEDRELPSTLRYFRASVEEAARRYAERLAVRAGSGAPVSSAGADTERDRGFAALLEWLADVGRTEPDGRVRDAYREAYRRLQRLRRRYAKGEAEEDGGAELITELVAVDAALIDLVVSSLDDAERAELSAAVAKALEDERPRLGARGLTDRRRALLEEHVTRRWGLVRLVPAPPNGPRVAGMGWWRPQETE